MKPLDNAEGPSPCQDSTLNSATSTVNNADKKIAHRADMRSNRDGQTALPSFVPAEALIPSPGRAKVALVVRDCPRCGGEHIHRCEDPAPSVLTRRAGCGAKYDLYPYRLKATKRGRRAA